MSTPVTMADVISSAPVLMQPAERLLLFSPVRALRPGRLLEIGTHKGGSAMIIVAALDDIAHADASRTSNDIWLPWLTKELRGLGLDVLPSVGNFVLVGFSSRERAEAANVHMMSDGLIPRLVAAYGLPTHLRITIGTEAEVKAVRTSLAKFVGRT